MKKKLFLIISLFALVFLGVLYYLNMFQLWGICRPGYAAKQIPSGRICYVPSGTEGDSCSTKSNCGSGYCRLERPGTEDPGTCYDFKFGCYSWIDEAGNYSADEIICID